MKTPDMHDLMLSVYKNEYTDITPIGIYSRYLPRGYKERNIRNNGFGIIDYFPVVSFMAPPWHNYAGFLSEVKGAEFDIKYRWEKDVMIERRTYSTPVGEVYQDVSKSIGAGSEFISSYYIKDIEDYKVLTYMVENSVLRRNEEDIRKKMNDLGQDGILLGRLDRSPYQKLLIELAGAQNFLMDLYTDPEIVEGLLYAMDKKLDEAFEMIIESQVEVLWQPDNITFDMTPPDNFEKYLMPFYEKHGKQAADSGKPYVVHIDGKLIKLEKLINMANFDVIESMSLPEISGDYTLKQAFDAYPGKVIIPNFPANLCYESDDIIREFMLKLIKEKSNKRAFMIQVSEDIPESEWERVFTILSEFTSLQEMV